MKLTFNEYQQKSADTAVYPNVGANYIYTVVGLAGETGEVAEKVKKVLRDKYGIFDDDSLLGIKKELGDVLWYLSQLASELGLDLDDIARSNLDKLQDRKERSVLQGSGDTR